MALRFLGVRTHRHPYPRTTYDVSGSAPRTRPYIFAFYECSTRIRSSIAVIRNIFSAYEAYTKLFTDLVWKVWKSQVKNGIQQSSARDWDQVLHVPLGSFLMWNHHVMIDWRWTGQYVQALAPKAGELPYCCKMAGCWGKLKASRSSTKCVTFLNACDLL